MRFQSHANSCGPSSVANALKSLGITITEEQVENAIAKTQRKSDPKDIGGSNEMQIKRALNELKCGYVEFKLADYEAAWRMLRCYIDDGNPALLAVDLDTHWVAGVGTIGQQILLADGADNELVVSMSKDALQKRWGHVGDVTTYYGMAVTSIKKRR